MDGQPATSGPGETITGQPERPWARLHPLSPALQFARVLVLVGAVFTPRLLPPLDAGGDHLPWLELLFGMTLVFAGVVTWLVTRWRVSGGELQIETGLLQRQSIRVPLRRIQAIDVVRPLLGRVLGLAELRIVLAGSGESQSRLAYLGEERAHEVRAELLALAHGLAPDTPVPAERRLLSVDAPTLVASNVLSAASVVTVATVIGIALALTTDVERLLLLSAGWPLLLGAGGYVVRQINTEYGFTVAEAPDGLRLRSGLLQTRAETVPRGRVQGVRYIEPVLWRPFGWCRLEIDVARQRIGAGANDSAQLTSALLPVGTPSDAEGLLSRVLPALDPTQPPGARPPARAKWRAPLSYRNLATWYDDRHVYARTGWFRPTLTVVPLEKVQSVRYVQGPLQRRLRLATLQVDTAGSGWAATAYARDEDEAADLLLRLPDEARRARRAGDRP